jgi:hypothetical protein
MNIRTWINICRFGFVLFILIGVGMFLPEDHWFRVVSGVATTLFVILGFCGAAMGLKFAFSKLHFGCAICNDRAEVLYGNQRELLMACKKCGLVRIHGNLFSKIKADVIEEDE